MAYVMLSNLQVVFLFICLIVKHFKKIFIRHLAMGNIVVYCIIIIPNILNKMANYMKFSIVKGWSTELEVDCQWYSNTIFIFSNLYNTCSI